MRYPQPMGHLRLRATVSEGQILRIDYPVTGPGPILSAHYRVARAEPRDDGYSDVLLELEPDGGTA